MVRETVREFTKTEQKNMTSTIGVIGLGIMGSAM